MSSRRARLCAAIRFGSARIRARRRFVLDPRRRDDIPTVSLAGGATTILADGKFDLNALTLTSEWMVRSTGAGEEETQPSCRCASPARSPRRNGGSISTPLLNLLQSRFTANPARQDPGGGARNAEEERRSAPAAAQEDAFKRRDSETPAPRTSARRLRLNPRPCRRSVPLMRRTVPLSRRAGA